MSVTIRTLSGLCVILPINVGDIVITLKSKILQKFNIKECKLIRLCKILKDFDVVNDGDLIVLCLTGNMKPSLTDDNENKIAISNTNNKLLSKIF